MPSKQEIENFVAAALNEAASTRAYLKPVLSEHRLIREAEQALGIACTNLAIWLYGASNEHFASKSNDDDFSSKKRRGLPTKVGS